MRRQDVNDLAPLLGKANERGQLFALDTAAPAGELTYMEPGAANELRGRARAGELICPLPGCPEPGFTTVGGTRRHHFRHLHSDGAGHDGESIAHQTAKHLTGRWARRRYPEARVEVDTQRVENGQLPDVLVELPDGSRYAFEIQYSPLSVDAWQQRHIGYRDLGIHDVWILGNRPPHLQRSRRDGYTDQPQLSALHQAIHAAGMPLLWINPFQELIGAALIDLESSNWLDRCEPGGFWGRIDIDVESLDNCHLVAGQMHTPALRTHLVGVARERAERERAERAEAARQRQRDAEARQRARDAESERAWREAQRESTYRHWLKFQDQVAPRLGGTIPDFLTAPLPSERLVWKRHPNFWRTRIFLDHVHGHINEVFTFADASRDLAASQTTANKMPFPFVSEFLLRLQQLGYVAIDSGTGRFITGNIIVLADLDSPPPHPASKPPTPEPRQPPPDTRSDTAVDDDVEPPGERPQPVDPSALPSSLRELLGVPGRRTWEGTRAGYIKDPGLRRVEFLEYRGPDCDAFGLHPPLWHHLVFERCVEGKIGRHVNGCEALFALGFTSRPDQRLVDAVGWFLDHLESHGFLESDGDDYRVIASL